MSCAEFEQNIYLYDELSTSERTLLDAHLKTCAACAALLVEVNVAQQAVKKIASDEVLPRHAARLTSGIMSKITTDTSRSSVLALPFFVRTRLALTVLSICLLASFAVEFLRDS